MFTTHAESDEEHYKRRNPHVSLIPIEQAVAAEGYLRGFQRFSVDCAAKLEHTHYERYECDDDNSGAAVDAAIGNSGKSRATQNTVDDAEASNRAEVKYDNDGDQVVSSPAMVSTASATAKTRGKAPTQT